MADGAAARWRIAHPRTPSFPWTACITAAPALRAWTSRLCLAHLRPRRNGWPPPGLHSLSSHLAGCLELSGLDAPSSSYADPPKLAAHFCTPLSARWTPFRFHLSGFRGVWRVSIFVVKVLSKKDHDGSRSSYHHREFDLRYWPLACNARNQTHSRTRRQAQAARPLIRWLPAHLTDPQKVTPWSGFFVFHASLEER